MRREELTVEILKSQLAYDPATGVFTWLVARGRYGKIGAMAGSVSKRDRYVRISLFGKYYLAHRLAWFYMKGEWPGLLDHRDRNPDNWAFDNLREATKRQNARNSGIRKNNTSGIQGVYEHGRHKGKYVAQIRRDGAVKYLGLFASKDEAAKAYRAAALEIEPDFSAVA